MSLCVWWSLSALQTHEVFFKPKLDFGSIETIKHRHVNPAFIHESYARVPRLRGVVGSLHVSQETWEDRCHVGHGFLPHLDYVHVDLEGSEHARLVDGWGVHVIKSSIQESTTSRVEPGHVGRVTCEKRGVTGKESERVKASKGGHMGTFDHSDGNWKRAEVINNK